MTCPSAYAARSTPSGLKERSARLSCCQVEGSRVGSETICGGVLRGGTRFREIRRILRTSVRVSGKLAARCEDLDGPTLQLRVRKRGFLVAARLDLACVLGLPHGRAHGDVLRRSALHEALLLLLQSQPGWLRVLPHPQARYRRRAGAGSCTRRELRLPRHHRRRADAPQADGVGVSPPCEGALSAGSHSLVHERRPPRRGVVARAFRSRARRDPLQRETR